MSNSYPRICGILADQSVGCLAGALGLVTGVSALNGARDLTRAREVLCGLMPDDTVKCLQSSGTPQVVNFDSRPIDIEGGCALLENGNVSCWDPSAASLHGASEIAGATAISYGSTDYHCAIVASGLKCWGNVPGVGIAVHPVLIPGTESVTQVASAPSHTCMTLANKTVACFGRNYSGEAGDPGVTSRPEAVYPARVVQGLTDVKQVAVGESFSCAVGSNGDVNCWGYNYFGQLGRGASGESTAIPSQVLWNDGVAPSTPRVSWGLIDVPIFADAKTGIVDPILQIEGEWGTTHQCSFDGSAFADCPGTSVYGSLFVSHHAATNGAHRLDVRSIDRQGNISQTGSFTWITLLPPPGPVGVSINGGDLYTNDPNVTIDMVWPQDETVNGFPTGRPIGGFTATLANDGGFRAAKTFQLGTDFTWKLSVSGAERLPRIAYVRFGTNPVTYSDDIILDQTAPTLSSASGSPTTVVARATSAAGTRQPAVRFRLSASDKTSGVGTVQITTNKAKPGSQVRYASTVTLASASKSFYVRVRDKAGNYSAWKTVKVR